METTLTKPKCKRCNGELTEDPKRECLVCLTCYPNALKFVPVPLPVEKKPFLDVAMTEARVREIVRDELENWHIQKPPVTKEDVSNLTATETVAKLQQEVKSAINEKFPPQDWRAQAKALNISLYHKKKADVLAEIAGKENEAV